MIYVIIDIVITTIFHTQRTILDMVSSCNEERKYRFFASGLDLAFLSFRRQLNIIGLRFIH